MNPIGMWCYLHICTGRGDSMCVHKMFVTSTMCFQIEATSIITEELLIRCHAFLNWIVAMKGLNLLVYQ